VERARFWPALGLVLAAAVVLHAPALRAPFFADDWLFLDQVRAHSLGAVLASPDPIGNFVRPLGRQVWFWFWGAVGRESPVPFHAANLALLLVSLVLLARLTRRLAGPAAGVVAAAYLAVHYAADVPVRWASGSQELLALALGLAALDAYASGRRALAAAEFFLALLAKESIVVLPLVAVALDVSPRPLLARARAAWPLAAAAGAWLALAAWATLRRGTPGAGLALTADGPLAVPVLLLRVILGLEWPTSGKPWEMFGDPGALALAALALALAGVTLAWPRRAPRENVAAARKPGAPRPRPARVEAKGQSAGAPPPAAPPGPSPRRVAGAGVTWALAGAAPVVAVAPLWSAYYLLFAIAGVGVLLGALLAARPRPAGVALVVLAALGWGSGQARQLQEFATAPSAWSGQSHVNHFYLDRGMSVVSRVVEDLRGQAPDVTPRTTFFYAGLPSFAAVQVADGPLVRSVFRDSSLRSYFLSQIDRARLARGPRRVFFYDDMSGRLEDMTKDPGVLLSMALGLMLDSKLEAAEATLEVAESEKSGDNVTRHYVRALLAADLGDTTRTRQEFLLAGYRLGADALEARRDAGRLLAGKSTEDTVDAINGMRRALHQHVLDHTLHGLLADALLGRPESKADGQLEAYAARALAPGVGLHWRRMAYVLAGTNRQTEALAALGRYTELDPVRASQDRAAQRLRAALVRMLPGGDLAQRSLTKEASR
jgi:hypothetical protein